MELARGFAAPHPSRPALRVLDLFSGAAGGWTLGLHRAGFKTVAACEADPWRRAVYSRNWPNVVMFDDVRTLSARALAGFGRIDVIAGSPPCQDASSANTKGRGIDGERTGLFREAVRLVRELRPRWVALENSPRLRTRGGDRVIDWLEAEDYTCWPFVVGADDMRSPHERKRMWLIAHAADARPEYGELERPSDFPRPDPDQDGVRQQPRDRRQEAALDSATADANGCGQLERAFDGEMAWILEHSWAGGIARHLRMADGVSPRLAAICRAAYGDAVLPQITEAIGRAILETESLSEGRDGRVVSASERASSPHREGEAKP